MSPGRQGISSEFPPLRRTSHPSGPPAAPTARSLSASLRPPRSPPASLLASPSPAPSAAAPTVTRASRRREARGASSPRREPSPRQVPRLTHPGREAARQRGGVFLCDSGFQLGGPRTWLSIRPEPRPDWPISGLLRPGGGPRAQSGRLRVPPPAPAAAPSQPLYARAGLRWVRALSLGPRFVSSLLRPGKHFVWKPRASLGVRDDPYSECSLKWVIP